MNDTSLIQACDDFIAAYHRLVEAARHEDAYDQSAMSLDRLANIIVSLAPSTMNGIRAKAGRRVIVGWNRVRFLR